MGGRDSSWDNAFEVAGCSETAAREALRLADTKLPFRCRFVTRGDA